MHVSSSEGKQNISVYGAVTHDINLTMNVFMCFVKVFQSLAVEHRLRYLELIDLFLKKAMFVERLDCEGQVCFCFYYEYFENLKLDCEDEAPVAEARVLGSKQRSSHFYTDRNKSQPETNRRCFVSPLQHYVYFRATVATFKRYVFSLYFHLSRSQRKPQHI